MVNIEKCIYFNGLNSHYNLIFVEKPVNLNKYNPDFMLKEIFTWWNGQTLGTRLWTYFRGILAGVDSRGNRYYHNKKDTKRWVIYADEIESTHVNPEWNNWLRFTSKLKASEEKKYKWQKNHLSNQTGTENAYNPEKNNTNNSSKKKNDDYTKWSP